LQPSGQAAGGGILRNSSGIFQGAFAANYGNCTITRAELRAVWYDLQLAWDMGYTNVNLQVDSEVVVSLIQSTGVTDLRHQTCIEGLRNVLGRDWMVKITHTYREGNRVADFLAHRGHSLPYVTHLIDNLSLEVTDCIRADMIGICFLRSIILNN
ncbi:Putative ribonuclease H protein At1g65750, partial [Linum grandiflorum]